MPAGGGDVGLCILDGANSPAERNAEALEASFQLETGKLEKLGRFSEIDPLGEVVADHMGFEEITGAVCLFAGGAQSQSPQEPVVEGVQEDDALLPSACHDGKLSFLDPIQDLSGPLSQVGWGDDGPRHRRTSSQEYITPRGSGATPVSPRA